VLPFAGPSAQPFFSSGKSTPPIPTYTPSEATSQRDSEGAAADMPVMCPHALGNEWLTVVRRCRDPADTNMCGLITP
ncbi:MAG: hypothetical protein ABGY41_03245, partial [Candidatus Poribacteria bacterium]